MCDKDTRITFVVSIWDKFYLAFVDLDSSRSGVGSRLVLFNRAVNLQSRSKLFTFFVCIRSIIPVPGPFLDQWRRSSWGYTAPQVIFSFKA